MSLFFPFSEVQSFHKVGADECLCRLYSMYALCGRRFVLWCLSTGTYWRTDFVKWNNSVTMLRAEQLSERRLVSMANPGAGRSGNHATQGYGVHILCNLRNVQNLAAFSRYW